MNPRNEELKLALASPEVFMQKIESASKLKLYALRNPNYARALTEMVLNNAEINKKLIHNMSDLLYIAESYPKYGEKLLKQTMELENSIVFKDSIPCEFEWIIIPNAVKVFPEYMNDLLEKGFENKPLFQKLVYNSASLVDWATTLPHHAARLIKIIISDKDEFKRVVTDNYDLHQLITALPYQADKLLPVLLYDYKEFDRLIAYNNYDLICREFPDEPIFKKSYFQAKYSILDAMEKERKSREHFSDTNNSLFFGTSKTPDKDGSESVIKNIRDQNNSKMIDGPGKR